MINYFYKFDYETDLRDGAFTDVLELHACVYAVADKYEVLDLKQLAMSKFAADAASVIAQTRNPLPAIKSVYSATHWSDKGLRDIVLQFWSAASGMVIKQQGPDAVEKTLQETPEFAVALAMKYCTQPAVSYKSSCSCGWNWRNVGKALLHSRKCDRCERGIDWKDLLGLTVAYENFFKQ